MEKEILIINMTKNKKRLLYRQTKKQFFLFCFMNPRLHCNEFLNSYKVCAHKAICNWSIKNR